MKSQAMLNRSIIACLAVFAVIAGMALSAGAQQMMTLSSSDGFFLPELMAMIEGQEKQVVIANKLPGTNLPKEYQAIDIIKGDIIMMINGKSISTAAEMEKIYNEVAIGQEIKLGVKREGVPRLVSFKKADPKNMPGLMMKRVTLGGEGADSSAGSGAKIIKMTPGGDMIPLPEIGLIVSAKDAKLKVEIIMPMEGQKIFTEEIKEGDIIRSIQGKDVSTKEEFQKIYDGIAVGEPAKLTVERSGKIIASNFTKIKAPKMIKGN